MDEIKIEIKGSKYGEGVIFQRYNGTFSLLSASCSQDGTMYPKWVFPQDKERQPMPKAIPMKVSFGADPAEVAEILKAMLLAVGGEDAPALGESRRDEVPF